MQNQAVKNDMQKYSTQEALAVLGIARRTLYDYVSKGIIPDRRNPKNKYRIFYEEDLEIVKSYLNGSVDLEGWKKKHL